MGIKNFLLILSFFPFTPAFSQTYPTFGSEIPVTVIGLTADAMEPFISADGNYIFYNSLNDGITTSLYYATKVNDSLFTFTGALPGANQTVSPRMDAVASSDSANNFYWMSLRNFPTQFDNYFHGSFNGTDIVNIGRVHGTFYIYTLGWLIMDAAINYDGSTLYYCNAFFNSDYSGCSGVPCKSRIGIAQRQNDSTFNKLINSDGILQNVNDTNYLVYAPFITKDGLELYFTRAVVSPPHTEICVSVRTNIADSFSLPTIIYTSAFVPEAPTLTTDKTKMYYHQKTGGTYTLFLRRRSSGTGIPVEQEFINSAIFPNPATHIITVNLPYPSQKYSIEIYSIFGERLSKTSEKTELEISNLSCGMYILKIQQENKTFTTKIVKN